MGIVSIEDNGRWLATSLHQRSTRIVCDGSYQPSLVTTRGATSWIIECSLTNQRAVGICGSNAYRSKLMGIYTALATILAVTTLYQIQDGELLIDCDNEKALYLSSLQGLKVPTSTKHADILRCIRRVCH